MVKFIDRSCGMKFPSILRIYCHLQHTSLMVTFAPIIAPNQTHINIQKNSINLNIHTHGKGTRVFVRKVQPVKKYRKCTDHKLPMLANKRTLALKCPNHKNFATTCSCIFFWKIIKVLSPFSQNMFKRNYSHVWEIRMCSSIIIPCEYIHV